MEVPDDVAGECGKLVWRGRPRPRTACSKVTCRASADFVCDLGRMQLAVHIRCDHSVHLDVEELSPLQDMGALAAFVAHADFFQDSCRRNVVSEMACENSVQLKRSESILHQRPGCFRGIAFPPMRDTDPVTKFGATMVGFDPKSHAAAQRVTLTQHDAEAQATAAQEFLLRVGDKVLSVGFGVRMWNAQRGRRHFARADKRHERWNVRGRVEAQRQPLSLQWSE
jgi:hypothetical protein